MHKSLVTLMLLGTLALAACSSPSRPAPTQATAAPGGAATPSAQPLTPTPTTEPAALVVNGEAISQSVFAAELQRLRQAAVATTLTDPQEQIERVRQYFIEQLLLAQGARANGYTASEEAIAARQDALKQATGSETFAAWLQANHYTEASFRAALRLALEADWMRNQIISAVPQEAEQVHLFHILLYNEEDARQVAAELADGADFLSLARQYDPQTGGDLGWLPPQRLFNAEIAQAITALPTGEVSQPLTDAIGYHLFYIQAREFRPLSAEDRLHLQRLALQAWLDEQRAASDIFIAP